MGVFNPQGDYALPKLKNDESLIDIQAVMRLVYIWMGLGLLTSALVAWFTANTPQLLALYDNPVVLIGSIIAYFGFAIALSAGLNRQWLTPNLALVLFFAFAAVTGFVLSSILLVYSATTIFQAFITAGILFGTMSFVGYTTKADLTKLGTYLFIGLIALIITSLLNIFLFRSTGLELVISIFGVIIFTGLTAYDTQKIKNFASEYEVQADGNLILKFSFVGAMILYLDFVNLFLFLLRLLGGGSRD